MEEYGSLGDCYMPDGDFAHNILFDSCVYDKRLATNPIEVEKLKSAAKNGFSFYYTHVQEREIAGYPDRKGYDNPWTPSVHTDEIWQLFSELNIKRVSCYGNPCYLYFVLLDGTYRLIEDKSSSNPRVQMFYEIFHNNSKHLRDAITAEAAIYNKCTLVSMDNRCVNAVNRRFPGRAFMYEDFMVWLDKELP